MTDLMAKMAEKVEPINDDFERVEEAEIHALEHAVGFKLPETYSRFLREFGRCMFAGEAVVSAGRPGPALSVFTMFGMGEDGNILRDREDHPDYVSKGLVPIANDNFGNRYVLKGKTGEIFFFDYSHGAGSEHKVAESFDDFLKRLDVTPWS